MFRVIKAFFNLSASRRGVLIEATVRASIALVMVRLLPYSVWRKWLGASVPLASLQDDKTSLSREERSALRDIVWAYGTLYRNARFFTCLMLGFSARALLKRRGYSGVLVLGVDRENAPFKSNLLAHAWVMYQGLDVAGGELKNQYVAVAAYGFG